MSLPKTTATYIVVAKKHSTLISVILTVQETELCSSMIYSITLPHAQLLSIHQLFCYRMEHFTRCQWTHTSQGHTCTSWVEGWRVWRSCLSLFLTRVSVSLTPSEGVFLPSSLIHQPGQKRTGRREREEERKREGEKKKGKLIGRRRMNKGMGKRWEDREAREMRGRVWEREKEREKERGRKKERQTEKVELWEDKGKGVGFGAGFMVYSPWFRLPSWPRIEHSLPHTRGVFQVAGLTNSEINPELWVELL